MREKRELKLQVQSLSEKFELIAEQKHLLEDEFEKLKSQYRASSNEVSS